MGAQFVIRRATLEDLQALTALWKLMRFDVDALTRRITEFQVAATPTGEIIGAVGLQIAQKQGCIHSEGFIDFTVADAARGEFWDRFHSIAANHGLVRLWTREPAPFWSHCGLAKADPEVLAKLPEPWRAPGAHWLTLKLREDVEVTLEKEFALYMQMEKERAQRRLRHVTIIKYVVAVIAFALFLVVLAGAFYLITRRHSLGVPRP